MMKTIDILKIENNSNSVSIMLDINGNTEIVTTTFSENVVQYITTDRIDSVVTGLMLFAIKHG